MSWTGDLKDLVIEPGISVSEIYRCKAMLHSDMAEADGGCTSIGGCGEGR